METTDTLSRTLRIIQERDGHRAASDDLFLAWAAARARPDAQRILDLGSGKGTVALLLMRCMPEVRVVGIEAHRPHYELAVRNASLNGLSHRYEARLGDLRESGVVLGPEERFDLICGAPPYLRVGSGILPRNPGRAAGRFELRGGIEAYAAAAARHLAEGARAVLLVDRASRDRAESALALAGLFTRRWLAVRPRPRQQPTYWLSESADCDFGTPVEEDICMRRATGMQWSPEYAAVREALDLPDTSG